MIPAGVRLKHYKRPEIQEAILACASNREVAVRFGDKGFGKRPDVLLHPNDVLVFAKKGATSFHVSEEIWSQPMQLDPSLKKHELHDLREGWDLVIDIDCDVLDFSKVAAYWVIELFKAKGVRSFAVKFSGNHGFHISIPSEAFPPQIQTREGIKLTKELFPEAPRKIATYLADMIEKPLGDNLLQKYGLDVIQQRIGKERHELLTKDGGSFNPFSFLAIDTVLIASRHLYRMPYSMHEKSGLVSIPIDPSQVLTFDKEWARAENIKHVRPYWKEVTEHDGADLLFSALDYVAQKEIPEEQKAKRIATVVVPETAYAETLFPPCIFKLQEGLEDGKKRMLFALVNFLASAGWSHDQIDQYVRKWNEKNGEPLRETYIVGQLRYAKMRKTPILPPNCDAPGYYKDAAVCCPDRLCRKIKNPIQYVKRRAYIAMKQEEEAEKERQKAERRKKREEAKKRKVEKVKAEKAAKENADQAKPEKTDISAKETPDVSKTPQKTRESHTV